MTVLAISMNACCEEGSDAPDGPAGAVQTDGVTGPDSASSSRNNEQVVASRANAEDATDLNGTIFINKSWPEPGEDSFRHALWAYDAESGDSWELVNKIQTDVKQLHVNLSHNCSQLFFFDDKRYGGDDRPAIINIMNIDGSASRSFTAPGSGYFIGPSAWSNDGSMIAYVRNEPQTGGGGVCTIYIIDTTGNVLHSFPLPFQVGGEIAFSPDGSRLAFTAEQEGAMDRNIYLTGIDGSGLINATATITVSEETVPGWGDPQKSSEEFDQMQDLMDEMYQSGRLIDMPDDPRWSPDGTRILYTAKGMDFRTEIREFDVATFQHRRLWGPEAAWPSDSLGGATWSPDGRYIAFSTSSDEPDQYVGEHMKDIWVMNADGSDVHMLIQGPEDEELGGWVPCEAVPANVGG